LKNAAPQPELFEEALVDVQAVGFGFAHPRMEQKFPCRVEVKSREDLMDQTTRCPKCGKRMVPVVTISGRTDLQCISCDDPAVKWAESPVSAPERPIAA
jgi:hypothetical protein